MLPGQLSFPGIPDPEPKPLRAPKMPVSALVALLAQLPPYRPSSPEEIAERRRAKRKSSHA